MTAWALGVFGGVGTATQMRSEMTRDKSNHTSWIYRQESGIVECNACCINGLDRAGEHSRQEDDWNASRGVNAHGAGRSAC